MLCWRIQRQEQIAQLQQAAQNQNQNQAANPHADQAGLQQDHLPVHHVEQNKGAEDNKNPLQHVSSLPLARPAGQVLSGQGNQGANTQPGAVNQHGDGIQREAGYHIEAGNQKEAGGLSNLVNHLQDHKGDMGLEGNNNQPVLPKPVNGEF